MADAYTIETIVEVRGGGSPEVIEVRPDPEAEDIIAVFLRCDRDDDTGLRMTPEQARLVAAALVRVAVAIESAP